MKFTILTIFPEIFEGFLKTSLLGKAIKEGKIEIELVNIRNFTRDKHRKVDDTPYGGGSGMVMMVEPIVLALESIPQGYKILLTPRGELLNQNKLYQLKRHEHIILICGRYEGIDERITHFIDEEISIGDYVLSGGEIPAMVIIEGVSRLLPGILGNENSISEESFCEGLLEYPQYTRPRVFRGLSVPKVLLSGNHKKIREWRRFQQLLITFKRRPELLEKAKLTEEDKEILKKIKDELK